MKRVLITSAIPYVAGVKHLGNLVGSMLPADIFARYCRSTGYDTLAICATDEHGAPVELAALEEGMPVAQYAAKWHAVQKELGDRFGLAWDNFGRSSSPQNPLPQRHNSSFCRTGFFARSTPQIARFASQAVPLYEDWPSIHFFI